MKKLLKIVGITFSLLLALVVVAAIAVTVLVDPNDYKGEITKVVHDKTGRELQIDGKIQLSLFPWIGLKLGQTELSNAPGFGKQPFAKVADAQVRVKLLPLLHKQLEMDTVVLKGLDLNLERNRQGRTNWQDLVAATAGKPAAEKAAKAPGAAMPAALAIGGVNLEDAHISWRDQMTGTSYTADKLNLSSGAIEPGKPVDVDLAFDLDSSKPAIKGHLALKGVLSVDAEKQQFSMNGMDFSAKLTGKDLPGGRLDARVKADLDLDLQKQLLKLADLDLEANGTHLKGALDGQHLLGKPALAGTLDGRIDKAADLLAPFAPMLPKEFKPEVLDNTTLALKFDLDLERQTFDLPSFKADGDALSIDASAKGSHIVDAADVSGRLQAKIKQADKLLAPFAAKLPKGFKAAGLDGSSLSTRFSADLGKQTLDLPEFKLDAAGVALQAKLAGSGIKNAPNIHGTLDVARFNARQVMQRLGLTVPETSDAKVLQAVQLNGNLRLGKDSAALQQAVLKLDDTTARIDFDLQHFAKPAMRFKADVDTIDLDRYLPPKQEKAQGGGSGAAGAGGGNQQMIPVDTLRGLNLAGTVTIKQLKAFSLRSRDVTLTLDARNGLVRLHPATAKLYQGSYSGDVQVDVRGRTPKLSVDEKVSGVQAGPLLKDMMNSDKLDGTGNFSAKLTTAGQNVPEWQKALNGNLAFAFTNGSIKGVNVAQLLREAKARLKGQAPPPAGENKTDFSELTGTATVTNGLVRNQDLSMKSPLLRVDGAGTADLPSQRLDYLAKVAVVDTLAGQGGKDLQDLKGLTIPLRVGGTFSQPKYSIDLKSVFEAKAKQAVKKEVEKTQEKAKQKLEDQLKKGFKGLLR